MHSDNCDFRTEILNNQLSAAEEKTQRPKSQRPVYKHNPKLPGLLGLEHASVQTASTPFLCQPSSRIQGPAVECTQAQGQA